ncbi:hypothetical protein OJJOAM_000070 [Cupriavidus sp. H18C1]
MSPNRGRNACGPPVPRRDASSLTSSLIMLRFDRPSTHHEPASRFAAALPVRETEGPVCGNRAERRAAADQFRHRRAQASDPALHPRCAGRVAWRAGELSHNGRFRSAAPMHRRLVGAPLPPAPRRPRQPGAAGHRLARGAVRLRPDRGRRHPPRRAGAVPEPLLSDLRGRRAAGRCDAGVRQQRSVPQFRARLRPHCRRRLAPRAAGLRLLAGQSDRRGAVAGGLAPAVRAVGPPRLRDRLRRVLFRKSISTRARRRWARWRRRTGWAAASSGW